MHRHVLLLKPLLEHSGDPLYRLVECDLLAASGDERKALESYENLIRHELGYEKRPGSPRPNYRQVPPVS